MAWAALVGCSMAVAPSLAAEAQYVLRAGVTHTDNAERDIAASEQPSTAASVGLDLTGRRATGRLQYDVASNLSYVDYFDDDIDSGVEGRASLAGQYRVSSGLRWNAHLSYEQLRQDLTRSLSPGNREDVLAYSTGPTLLLRLASALEAEVQGNYARTHYSERPFDNQTLHGRMLLARRSSPLLRLAVGGSYADINYLSSINQIDALDFRRREGFVRAELQGVRTDLELELGYSDASGDTVDDGGLLIRGDLSRRVTPSMRFFLLAVREYPTSEPSAFSADSLLSGGTYSSADLTAGPRLTENAETGLQYERSRTTAGLGFGIRRERAATDQALSRRSTEIRGSVGRRVTPNSTLSLEARISEERISTFGAQEFDDRLVAARWNSRFGRALGVEFWVERYQRKGSVAAGRSTETRGGIFATWSGEFGRSRDR